MVDFGKIKKQIGNNIRKYRKQAGLTQVELSIQADLTDARITQIERGLGAPSMLKLFMIAEALKIPASKLLEQTIKPP